MKKKLLFSKLNTYLIQSKSSCKIKYFLCFFNKCIVFSVLFILFILSESVFSIDYDYIKKYSSETRLQTLISDLKFNEPITSLVTINTLTGKMYYSEEIGQKVYFIKAMLLKKLNRQNEMVAALEDAVKNNDVLTDYALLELAKYYHKVGKYEKSVKYAEKLLQLCKDSILTEDAILLCSKIQISRPGYKSSINILNYATEDFKTAESAYNVAELFYKSGKFLKSLDYYKLVIKLNHNNSFKSKAVKRITEILLYDKAGLHTKSKIDNIIFLVNDFLNSENFNEALTILNALHSCPEKYYYTGMTYYKSGNYNKAAELFKTVFDRYTSTSYHTKSKYYRFAAGMMIENYKVCEKGLRDFIKNYPYDEMTDNAYYSLAEYYLKKGNKPSEALEMLKKIRNVYPNKDSYIPSLWLEANYYKKVKDYGRSAYSLTLLIQHLSEKGVIDNNKDELIKAIYWRGKIFESNGQYINAAKDFLDVIVKDPMGFYTYRSFTKLKPLYSKLIDISNSANFSYLPNKSDYSEIIQNIETNLANREKEYGSYKFFANRDFRDFDYREIETENFSGASYKEHFYKYYILKSLREFDYAIKELEHVMKVKDNDPKFVYNLAHTLTEAGNINRAIDVVETMISKFGDKFSLSAMPRKLKTLLYPQYYSDLVTYNASKNNVDFCLVYAIIREESRFRTFATSPAGACGLMQIMPNTGKWIANKTGMSFFRPADLYIPHLNIKMGSWYFSYLLKKYENDVFLSLAAYNGGHGNVSNWVSQIRSEDIDEFIEKIPFRETKNYVKKVMTSYNIYKQIYDNGYNMELTSSQKNYSNSFKKFSRW
ncbi:transglycosylase SLT domain-containing protein [Candidatus Dependentiae bacterium]|nr:transglycosylase SLT domain-containing protein [Candidatus Dependentiae bacterium]